MRRAVVDVGSNSVLLTVCELFDGGWRELHWTSEVTGLGTDTKGTGLLREDAQERTLEAVKRAFETARAMGAECVAGATMAVRIATNAAGFLDRAERQGTPILILSGEDEAQLGLEAVMGDAEFRSHVRISVIDPGGHSTELTTAVRTDGGFGVEFRRSFHVGALGLREGTMGGDSPDRGARLRAVVEIDEAIMGVSSTGGVAVALGATPTNLASVRGAVGSLLALPHPQPPPRDTDIRGEGAMVHGQWLDYEEVSRAVEWMCEMPEAERRELPGLEKGREKTIHIGALILERFLNALRLDGCFVSTRGWRHAMLDRDELF